MEANGVSARLAALERWQVTSERDARELRSTAGKLALKAAVVDERHTELLKDVNGLYAEIRQVKHAIWAAVLSLAALAVSIIGLIAGLGH